MSIIARTPTHFTTPKLPYIFGRPAAGPRPVALSASDDGRRSTRAGDSARLGVTSAMDTGWCAIWRLAQVRPLRSRPVKQVRIPTTAPATGSRRGSRAGPLLGRRGWPRVARSVVGPTATRYLFTQKIYRISNKLPYTPTTGPERSNYNTYDSTVSNSIHKNKQSNSEDHNDEDDAQHIVPETYFPKSPETLDSPNVPDRNNKRPNKFISHLASDESRLASPRRTARPELFV